MEIEIINGKETIVKIMGRVDTATASTFDQEIAGLINTDNKVVFDCEELEYIASAGLRVLLNAYKSLQHAGGSMALINVKPAVMDVLNMTGFSLFMTVNE